MKYGMKPQHILVNAFMWPVMIVNEIASKWPCMTKSTRLWAGPLALVVAPVAIPGLTVVGALMAVEHFTTK